MTEPTDHTVTPASMPAHLAGTEPEQDEQPPKTVEWYENEVRKLRKESANYRTKLREAETEIGAAAAQLDAMRYREVERLAAEHLRDPADVWQAQRDMAAYLDDEYGTVDPDKVAEAAQSLVTEKPHYAADKQAAPPPTNRPIEGLRGGATPGDYSGPTQPTWADVIPRPLHSRMAGGE